MSISKYVRKLIYFVGIHAVASIVLFGYITRAHAVNNEDIAEYIDIVYAGTQSCLYANLMLGRNDNCLGATPKKCRPQMATYLAAPSYNVENQRQSLNYCLASCRTSSIWSKNFGECSREF